MAHIGHIAARAVIFAIAQLSCANLPTSLLPYTYSAPQKKLTSIIANYHPVYGWMHSYTGCV